MTRIKLHYDGWLTLPADLCRALGLSTGDQVEAALVNGAIVLRPAAKDRPAKRREPAPTDLAATDGLELPSTAADAAPVKRRPGRPRKAVDPAAPAPEPKRGRGRPRKVVAATEAAAGAVVSVGPAKLLKKADLPPKPAPAEVVTAPAFVARPAKDDFGARIEERRPFRQVEVRKLGPGRGHNRSGRRASGSAV